MAYAKKKAQQQKVQEPINVQFNPNIKQLEAFQYLTSEKYKHVSEILYGGGAGGGKSYFGCAWLILMCLKYPGTRWLIGRSELKNLKLSTLNSFHKVVSDWNILPAYFTHNQQSDVITWHNGSEIILKDLKESPSDPNYSSLGSIEISGAFLDESQELTENAKNIVSSRIRYQLDKYKLTPKLLLTCNPQRGYLYDQFYMPWKQNKLLPYRKFVQALYTDNTEIDSNYALQLDRLSGPQRNRLKNGEWDSEEQYNLIAYDKIMEMFNSHIDENDIHRIAVDVARLGKDKSIIMIFKGKTLIELVELAKNTTDQLVNIVLSKMKKYNVIPKHVIIDSAAVGAGTVDYIRGCTPYLSNHKALHNSNYKNLSSQCFFQLADMINRNELNIHLPLLNAATKERIIKELEFVRAKNVDKDAKLEIIPKEEIKPLIGGKSPDYADCLSMFAWFFIPSQFKTTGEYAIRTSSSRRR